MKTIAPTELSAEQSVFASRSAMPGDFGKSAVGPAPVLLLAGSVLAGAASVPVLLAAFGAVPVGHLLYVGLLVGLLTGSSTLLAVRLGYRLAALWTATSRQTPPQAADARPRWRARLAWN
ncbi:MAG: hypothetical protein AAGG38_05330 [Planctomycetota bacterium]